MTTSRRSRPAVPRASTGATRATASMAGPAPAPAALPSSSSGTQDRRDLSPERATSTTIRWPRAREQLVTEWLCRRDRNVLARNFSAYQARKTETCLQMLTELKLRDQEPLLNEKKVLDKIGKMVERHKEVVKVLDQTGEGTGNIEGEEDPEEREWTGTAGRAGVTIKAFIERACHWYSAFDEVMGTKANIRPPFVASSSGPNLDEPRRRARGAESTNNTDADLDDDDDGELAQRILDEEAPMPNENGDEEEHEAETGEGEDGETLQGGDKSANVSTEIPSGAHLGQKSAVTKKQGPRIAKRQGPAVPAKKQPSIVDAFLEIESRQAKRTLDRDRSTATAAAETKQAVEAAERAKWTGEQQIRWAEVETTRKSKEAEIADNRAAREEREGGRRSEREEREEERRRERKASDFVTFD
ncbi:hypothetical protein CF327_g6981 [Tilletia walkeri]|nr:hypothetical protein CF327_g6981 [Tilletia walkeri]